MKSTAQTLKPGTARPIRRDPNKTRETILRHAYQQIHEFGFQSVSLDAILRDTGVTKGALYHHFPNKHALGYAVIEEVIAPELEEKWIQPILISTDPIHALIGVIKQTGDSMSEGDLRQGCPLNNLAQEMSTLDEGFRLRIEAVYESWRKGLAQALANGMRTGTVKQDLDTNTTAAFIIASMEGCIGIAKNAQSLPVLHQCGAGIIDYLQSLRITA